MSAPSDNVQVARRYLAALEGQVSADELARFLAPDAELTLLPNRLQPKGETRDRAKILETFELGKKILASQRYEVLRAFEHQGTVVLEVLWTGTLSVRAGSLPPGTVMRVHSAMFIEFADGKITRQRNYDGFEDP